MRDDASIPVFVPETHLEHLLDEEESHNRVSPQRKWWETVEPASPGEDTAAEAAFVQAVVEAVGQQTFLMAYGLDNQDHGNEEADGTWEEEEAADHGHQDARSDGCTLVPLTCEGHAQSSGDKAATNAAGNLGTTSDVAQAGD